jgi:hypothetical protein
MQNKAIFDFHFDIFIFENKYPGNKKNAIRPEICPVSGCCGMPVVLVINSIPW